MENAAVRGVLELHERLEQPIERGITSGAVRHPDKLVQRCRHAVGERRPAGWTQRASGHEPPGVLGSEIAVGSLGTPETDAGGIGKPAVSTGRRDPQQRASSDVLIARHDHAVKRGKIRRLRQLLGAVDGRVIDRRALRDVQGERRRGRLDDGDIVAILIHDRPCWRRRGASVHSDVVCRRKRVRMRAATVLP